MIYLYIVVYNMDDNKVVEGSFDNSLSYENLTFSAGYYYTKKTNNEFNTRDDLESYRLSTSYKLAKDYSIKYYENYDLQEKTRNRQGIGLNIDDSCWNLDLRFENEIVPTSRLDNSAENGIDQKIVYITVMLKPLGGIKQKYKMQDGN